MNHTRNPQLMTFREVFSEFGTGTLSSSSPASRRSSHMSFTPHRREGSASRPSSARSTPTARPRRRPRPKEKSSELFHRMNVLLLRSHYGAIISTLYEDGWVNGSQRDRLLEYINNNRNHSNELNEIYFNYLKSKQISNFLTNLIQISQHH